jgi:hypothetical protein
VHDFYVRGRWSRYVSCPCSAPQQAADWNTTSLGFCLVQYHIATGSSLGAAAGELDVYMAQRIRRGRVFESKSTKLHRYRMCEDVRETQSARQGATKTRNFPAPSNGMDPRTSRRGLMESARRPNRTCISMCAGLGWTRSNRGSEALCLHGRRVARRWK